MSFEGYWQHLCKKGHGWTEDCYQGYFDDNYEAKCPKCFGKSVWSNLVDVTNGSFYENERIDGYIELEEKERHVCDKCKSVLEVTYKIPKKRKSKRGT
jgi:hypothetical protein